MTEKGEKMEHKVAKDNDKKQRNGSWKREKAKR